MERHFFFVNDNQNRAGVAIFMFNKINFKLETVKKDPPQKKDKEEHDIMRKVNSPGRYLYKHISIQHQNTQIYEANSDRPE